MRNRRSRIGFTLIEILVALSIMVIVLGAAYGTFRAATNSVSRCKARKTLEEDGQGLLRMMAREIRCSYFPAPGENRPVSSSGTTPPATPATPAPIAAARSERPAPQYLNGTSDGQTGSLQLLTTAGMADPDQPASGLYNIAYQLDAVKKRLLRRQADLLQPRSSDTDSPHCLCVARRVESLAYSFSDGKDWSNAWQTDDVVGLPSAVRISIVLSDADGNQRAFSTTVFVPTQNVPSTQTVVQPAKPKQGGH